MTKAAELAKMGEVLSNSQVGRKNIIINGGMICSQRATSSTGLGATTAGYTTLDRYAAYAGADATAGRYTMSQSAVTDLEGFSNALKIDCTTADTSIAAGEALLIQQGIEGFNLQQLKATSTTTRAFTLSFSAKSNASRAIVTELLITNGTNRQASKVHTIGTSWARYTFTVPAASSTQIDNDNTNEMQVNFWLHAGSTYSGGTITNVFAANANANRAAGAGSIFSSTDNTLEITGVQLEVGSQATPFEHRSFAEELQLCKRYYHKLVATGPYQKFAVGTAFTTDDCMFVFKFNPEMRGVPTLDHGTLSKLVVTDNDLSGEAIGSLAIDTNTDGPQGVSVKAADITSDVMTAGDATILNADNDVDAFLAFDAEL